MAQLTLFTDKSGKTNSEKDSTHSLGPYIKKKIPINPFNNSSGVTCDITETDITVASGDSTDGTGWKFRMKLHWQGAMRE